MAGDPRHTPAAPDPQAASIDTQLTPSGTAFAAVAHEINNPITYVLGNLAELERLTAAMREVIVSYRELSRGSAQGDAAGVIAGIEAKLEQCGGIALLDELLADTLEGARRIRDLVRDLDAATRGAELHKEVLDVAQVIDSSLRLVAPHFPRPAELERDYRATRFVRADRMKLDQVLLNLLTNAADACAESDKPCIRIRTRDCDGGVAIEIEDTGPGICESTRSQLFTPFFTTKQPGAGTGLGLYISRRIVEEHGGSIGFRCPESGGTIFSVYLPVEEA